MDETSRNLHNASTLLLQRVSCCGIRPLRLSTAPMEETSRKLYNTSTLLYLAVGELLWNPTHTLIHRPDGRNFQEAYEETSRKLHNANILLLQGVSCCGIRPLRLSMAPMEETSRKLHDASTVPFQGGGIFINSCLLYTSPSPRDGLLSRMPSSA